MTYDMTTSIGPVTPNEWTCGRADIETSKFNIHVIGSEKTISATMWGSVLKH